jgi:hypothetical protein
MPLKTPPLPSINVVDRLCHQLAEIHAITVTQLVEYACWRGLEPTSSLVHTKASL